MNGMNLWRILDHLYLQTKFDWTNTQYLAVYYAYIDLELI